MDRFERLEHEKTYTAAAKSISVLFVAGLVALLVGHSMFAPSDDGVTSAPVPAPAAAPGSAAAGQDLRTGYLPAAARSAADARAAARDEPPIPTF